MRLFFWGGGIQSPKQVGGLGYSRNWCRAYMTQDTYSRKAAEGSQDAV